MGKDTQTTRRPRRSQVQRRADSEAEILAAATRLIAVKGAANLRLAEIADEAGVSRGLPTYIYGSKDDLLAAVADHICREFRAQFMNRAVDWTGAATIESFVGDFVAAIRAPNSHGRIFMALASESLFSVPGAWPTIQKNLEAFEDFVGGWIRQAQARGDVPAGVDVPMRSAMVAAILRGAAMAAAAEPERADERLEAELVKAVLNIIQCPVP
jgi:AcrR family transcriptional regulator